MTDALTASGRASRPVVPRPVITEDERVLSGALRCIREAAEAGRPLLGELPLAERLGCSRQQVRRALAVLEQQGIVRRSQGAPTTVDPLALRLSSRFDARVEYSEVLARMGYAASAEVMSSGVGELDAKMATLLEMSAGTRCIRVRLRWFADHQPAMVGLYTLPLPVGHRGDFSPTDSVFDSARDVWGEDIAWEVVTAGVSVLGPREAQWLDLTEGGAAKQWEVVGVTLSGRRILHSAELHHPDLLTYSFVRSIRPPWSVAGN
ncbi:GntR family transcriptional regulator [Georgenia sp. H159]|uniref:GntR family transcriptional regulator n=1 Tax=Georgenia sp. H159 TaxID=3076115 RepID=UPI002D795531|nr:GntR family transcriptional regulator [Georgenia sp. H159]